MRALNTIHELMIVCYTKKELQIKVNEVGLNNLFNDNWDDLMDSIMVNPVLAGPCSVLPKYYFNADKYGYKQDCTGRFYRVRK